MFIPMAVALISVAAAAQETREAKGTAITAEGYISKTKDLLMEVQVASQSGFNSKFTNLTLSRNVNGNEAGV